MRKSTRSAVLLITGSHVTALDFDLLIENLSRNTTRTAADDDSLRLRASRDEQDGDRGTNWASEDDLAPARDFINRQHVAGEPWFCYVNPRIRPDTDGSGRAARVTQRARRGEAAARRTSGKSGHSR
jgi:hypothetical protein